MNERIYYTREAEMQAERERLIMALIVAAFGIGIGAVLALLMAPRRGEDTRRQIGETLDQATSQGRGVAGEVVKTVVEGAGRLGQEVSERLQNVVNQ
ncbi:MAG: YtxH domain-containing protein [Chloroflexi bacterium]|nr:YtxH domain-containing protein [Chloroflexota bacterium]